MGSPIEVWEGADAYFTGAGGSMPFIWFLISLIVVILVNLSAFYHENKSYKDHRDDPH